jgi:FMN reductase [NAD(P)H]
MQAYSIVVSRDPERKKALAACHFNQPQVVNAPVVLTFCADFNRFSKWCAQRNAQAGFNNVQALTYASIDAVIVAQTFCVAAEEKGLGICYLGTTTYLAKEIIELLELPPLVFPVTTVSVGYPLEPPKQCERLPQEAVVHSETYRDYTPADIDRLHLAKEQLPENRHFVEINHKENLAQVFAEIRYTKKDNEHFSDTLVRAVKKQGFC